MNAAIAQAYIDLHVRKKALSEERSEVIAEMESLEEVLINEMLAEGVQSVRIGDGAAKRTLYRKVTAYPKFRRGFGREDIITLLRSVDGCEHMVNDNYNTGSFTAYVNEQHKQGTLDPEFLTVISVSEKVTLGVTS